MVREPQEVYVTDVKGFDVGHGRRDTTADVNTLYVSDVRLLGLPNHARLQL